MVKGKKIKSKKIKSNEKQTKDIINNINDKKDDPFTHKIVLQNKVFEKLALKKPRDATELIVESFKKKNYVYSTRNIDKCEMWIYHNGIYIPQAQTFIKEFCRDILGKASTSQLLNEIIDKIQIDTYVDQTEFFAINNIWEIPVQNGILNLKTKKLSKFTPTKIFFNKLGMNYNPKAKCPAIDKHFKEVLPTDEDITVMEEVFGSTLLKDYRIEKAIIMLGFGRNGKGKTITLLKNFVGHSYSAVPLKNMKEDNFRVCDMFGKLANLSGDLSNTSLKDTGCLKMLIGRDPINADRKHKDTINFVNYAKIIFAANELPRVYDTTDGFWDKWIPFVFPYKFITQEEINKLSQEDKKNKKIIDPDHIEKISTEEELSGFLNKALDGLDRLLKNDNYSYSPSGSEIKSWWIRKSDSFAAFCSDCIKGDYESFILKKELQNKFSKYCKALGLNGVGPKSIKATMENEFGSIIGRKYVKNERSSDPLSTIQADVWEGVNFNDDIEIYFQNLKKDSNKCKKEGFSTFHRKLNLQVKSKNLTYSPFLKKNVKNEKEKGDISDEEIQEINQDFDLENE